MNKLRIATMREQEKWTQSFVAKQIGITKQAYSNIETGKRNPSYKIIVKLQKLFKNPIDYLLEQEIKETQQNDTTTECQRQ